MSLKNNHNYSLVEIENLIEVVVYKIVTDVNDAPVLLLAEKGGSRMLPIWIGDAEAIAISVALEKKDILRPFAHDLFCRLVEALDGRITMVVVNKLKDNVFYARIIITQGDKILSLDARPSDAIAIALRSSAQIYVTRDVMDKGGLNDIEPQ